MDTPIPLTHVLRGRGMATSFLLKRKRERWPPASLVPIELSCASATVTGQGGRPITDIKHIE